MGGFFIDGVSAVRSLFAMEREAEAVVARYSRNEPARWDAASGTESWLEDRLLSLFNKEPKLRGRFRCNVPIGPYRPDFVFTDLRFCVEADGVEWHSSEEDMHSDCVRDLALARMGWHVFRLWHVEIVDTPDIAVDRVIARMQSARLFQRGSR